VTRLRAGRLDFDSQQGKIIFLIAIESRPALGPNQPPIQGYPGFYPGVKQPEHEADNSLLSSADVKNVGSYTPKVEAKSLCFN
jgi:hypothetical protein